MKPKMLHTCLRVGNLDASMKFYNEVLQLNETQRKVYEEYGFTLVYLSDESGHYELELTYNYDTSQYEIGNGFSHIAIGVDDLELEHTRLTNLGYETTKPKGLPGNKPNYFFVKDPDGYQVEVIRNK